MARALRPPLPALLALLLATSAPTANGATLVADGARCSLADAIVAANTDRAAGGCTAGSGPDTVRVATDVTLSAADNAQFGPTGLPVVSSDMRIEGAGRTISRAEVDERFRLLAVGSDGRLTVAGLTLSQGRTVINALDTRDARDARSGGAAYVAEGGHLTLDGVTLRGNKANYGGGAVISAGTLIVRDSLFEDNLLGDVATVYPSTVLGGAIHKRGGTLDIRNSRFVGNTNGDSHRLEDVTSGGAVYASEASVRIADSVFERNGATRGGAVQVTRGDVTASNTRFEGNSASSIGAALSVDASTLSVVGGWIEDNRTSAALGGRTRQ